MSTSTEEPPASPPAEAPPGAPPEPPLASEQLASQSPGGSVALPPRTLAIIGGLVVLVLAVAFALFQMGEANRAQNAENFVVQPYKPPSQLISAGDHVVAYERPDTHSQSIIMFGPGIALDVTGRVSRGLGDDWYAIMWNGQRVFIRQQDAVAGIPTAPPETAPRVPPLPPREDTTVTTDENAAPEEAPPPVADGPPDLSAVGWIDRPSQRDFQRVFPRRALYDGTSGRVTLECTARASGALDCAIADEDPRGYGFGRAALAVSRKFRLAPVTADGRSVAGGHISIPVEFRAN